MRKNLFLTLALAFASIATVNAQWLQILASGDGLPGKDVTDQTAVNYNCTTFKSELITPGEALNGFRFTVIQTKNNEKPDGHPCFSFAEMKIYDAQGNEVKFTAETNAQDAAEGPIANLNNGKAGDYFHSNWHSDSPTGEFHYLEITFEKPLDAFAIETWARKGNPKNTPTLVGLTKLGQTAVLPEATYELGSQLTTLEDLLAADYVTIKGNAPEDGADTSAKAEDYNNFDGWGARFLASPTAYTPFGEEATADNAVQIIPTNEGNTYYLYWPTSGTYLKDADFSGGNDLNAWAAGTTNKAEAAKISFKQLANGDFEMSYESALNNGTAVYVWLAAEPRVGTNCMKFFTMEHKGYLEGGDYTKGYSLPVRFNFSFYTADYAQPAYVYQNTLKYAVMQAENTLEQYGEQVEAEAAMEVTFYQDALEAIASTKEIIAGGDYTAKDVDSIVEALNATIDWYILTVGYQAAIEIMAYRDSIGDVTEYDDLGEPIWGENSLFCDESSIEPGKYLESDWNSTLGGLLNDLIVYINDAMINEDPTAYVSNIKTAANRIADKKAEFENKVIAITSWPVMYANEKEMVWAGDVITTNVIRPSLTEPIKDFRITFLESNAGSYGGYPMIAMMEMEVFTGEGVKINLTESNVKGYNSIEESEGSIAGLFDMTYNEDGSINNKGDFYHSIWGSGESPKTYIYLDIELPAEIETNDIMFKFYVRQSHMANPTKIYVGNIGEEYDPVTLSENTYNVRSIAQVSYTSEFTDWGLYAIKGLLNANPTLESPADEMFYAGKHPFHKSALRENGVYFFTKNEDGTINIRSLSTGKYWAANGSETITKANAGNFNIVASTNEDFDKSFVIYTDVEGAEPTDIDFTYAIAEGDSVRIQSTVTPAYRVLMDWGASWGTYARACANPQPGVIAEDYAGAEEEMAKLTAAQKASGAFGDYLYFNKTNGEGEWKIYQVSMKNPYYFWLTSLNSLFTEELGYGSNPGQLPITEEVAAELATVQSTIAKKDYSNAEAVAKAFAETIEEAAQSEGERNPIVADGTYFIQSANAEFPAKYYMYATEDSQLRWGDSTKTELNNNFFKFVLETPSLDLLADFIAEGIIDLDAKDVYLLKNVETGEYVGKADAKSTVFGMAATTDEAGIYKFELAIDDCYTIARLGQVEGEGSQIHANGHGGGKNSDGNIVYWDNDGSKNASVWQLITASNASTSISDLVVEGDEVKEINYYTVGGVKTAAPAKGLNIVEIIYKNNAVETKKIIVE